MFALAAKKSTNRLSVMTCKRNVPYLSNLIGVTTCDMLIYFAPVLPVTCPDPVL